MALWGYVNINVMKRNVIAFIVAILSAVNASAFDDVSTAYSFLDITSSSHVYGLGGVNVSLIDDDINIVEQNPALLGPELGSQLGVNYIRYIGSSNFAGVKYGHSAGTHGAWAASMQYFGYGEMKSTDVTGSVTGTFSPKDICFSGTYSHDITTALRGGVTLKGVYSDYEAYSAFALAVDLGLNYYDGDNDMSLSLVVTNLGGQLKRFNEVYERLPVDVRIGWSQGLHGLPFRLSVTAWNLTRWHLPYYDTGDGTGHDSVKLKDSFMSNLLRHLVFAGEYEPNENFYIGIGYNYKTRTDMNTYSRNFFSGFSIGSGIRVHQFGIGAALAQPHVGAMTFMFNLAMRL